MKRHPLLHVTISDFKDTRSDYFDMRTGFWWSYWTPGNPGPERTTRFFV